MSEFDLRDDRFSRASGGGLVLRLGKVTEVGGIAKGATGTVQPIRGAKGAETAFGPTIELYSRFGDAPEDAEVLYGPVNGSGLEIIQSWC